MLLAQAGVGQQHLEILACDVVAGNLGDLLQHTVDACALQNPARALLGLQTPTPENQRQQISKPLPSRAIVWLLVATYEPSVPQLTAAIRVYLQAPPGAAFPLLDLEHAVRSEVDHVGLGIVELDFSLRLDPQLAVVLLDRDSEQTVVRLNRGRCVLAASVPVASL